MIREITTGSDFSGVGAFDYAIERVCKEKGLNHKRIYACDWDKFARITYAHNHGEPEYYPKDVYDREIQKESLDIYMTSPPCQAFSLSGKRKGKDDERGVLFFNSHEFIQKNNPRFFIFENVKGLLSDDGGKTFQEWVNMLSGKSVNGVPVLFPHEDSVLYHLYWKVLNSKNYGVPQNRERVFLVGIRDDQDNSFRFPKEETLTKKLKDLLESEVDEKYFLSDKAIKHLINHKEKHDEKGTGFGVELKDGNSIASTLRANGALCPTDNHIKIKSATKKGYEVAQTLDTSCNQAVIIHNIYGGFNESEFRFFDKYSPTIRTAKGGGHIPSLLKDHRIRRLTPRECFRLQDFPDTFDFSVVSDTQAYKQAGNSITVRVLELILRNLPL
jgi:DNA (cytosine-5)-methyltransferase 1